MVRRFEFAGLCVSTEIHVPELSSAPTDRPFDVSVVGEDITPPVPAIVTHQWTSGTRVEMSLRRSEGTFVVEFDDGTLFAFDDETRTVTCPTNLDATSRHQLLDHVLPRVLDHLGHLMIHGSAIATRRGAVVFIGDSGRGKSTLAASLHGAGVEVLSDDCLRVAIDGDTVGCVPTYRSLRLWPDSASAVMATAVSVPMAGDAGKRRIALSAQPPVGTAPVVGLCVLGAPGEPSSPVTFAEVPPARAVSLLLAQSFRLDPTDKPATARAFDRCVDVVERVPVVELRYPRDYGRLPEVRDAVLQRAVDGWGDVTVG